VADVIKTWPPKRVESEQGETKQGLVVRLQLSRDRAEGVLDLGDQARFWPSDEALARWRTLAHEGRAAVVYE
jgi:DNA polymerase III subunit alpha